MTDIHVAPLRIYQPPNASLQAVLWGNRNDRPGTQALVRITNDGLSPDQFNRLCARLADAIAEFVEEGGFTAD